MEDRPRLTDEAAPAGAEGGDSPAAGGTSRSAGPVRRALAWIGATAVRWIESSRSWLFSALLIAVSPGLFAWPVLHHGRLSFVLDNQLSPTDRIAALTTVLWSILLVAGLYSFVAVRAWRRLGAVAARESLIGLNDRLLAAVVLPFIPVLLVPRVETTAPWLTLIAVAGAAATTCAAAYRFPLRQRDRTGHRAFWLPALVVALLAVAYAAVAARYSVGHHHNLGTTAFDLALYDNIFWSSSHGNPLGSTLTATGVHTAAHVDPILILLSPLYLLCPRAELLLVLQSVWLASAAIPAYLLARRRLGRPWLAVALGACVLLHPAVHGANFYDFHSLTLAGPLLLWAVYCMEAGALRWYWVVLALLLLTRDDVALLCCFLGLYPILTRKAPSLGVATIIVSALYFVAARVFVAATAGQSAYSFAYYYSDIIPGEGNRAIGFLSSVVANPFFVIRHVLSPAKLQFLVTMLLPVLFLPIVARQGKVLLVYGLTFILLASRAAVYSVHFQYSTLLYPMLFCLLAIVLSGLRQSRIVVLLGLDARRLTGALVAGVLVASVGVSVKFGGLVHNDSFRAGFERFTPHVNEAGRERYEWVEQAVAQIPGEASVSASRHMAPHVSNRPEVYSFPEGWGADYLFVDRDELDPHAARCLALLRSRLAYEVAADRGARLLLLRRRPGAPLPDRPSH